MADELISRDALLKAINDDERGKNIHHMRSGKLLLSIQIILEHLHFAPTVDAVEVVRCKDCEYFLKAEVNGKDFLICQVTDKEIFEDDFCSYGERKENGEM